MIEIENRKHSDAAISIEMTHVINVPMTTVIRCMLLVAKLKVASSFFSSAPVT